MSREQPVGIELDVEDGEHFEIVPELEHRQPVDSSSHGKNVARHTDNDTKIDGRRIPK